MIPASFRHSDRSSAEVSGWRLLTKAVRLRGTEVKTKWGLCFVVQTAGVMCVVAARQSGHQKASHRRHAYVVVQLISWANACRYHRHVNWMRQTESWNLTLVICPTLIALSPSPHDHSLYWRNKRPSTSATIQLTRSVKSCTGYRFIRETIYDALDACLNQFLASAEPAASEQNSMEMETHWFISILQLTAAPVPLTSHVLWNPTCLRRQHLLLVSVCSAHRHACSQT